MVNVHIIFPLARGKCTRYDDFHEILEMRNQIKAGDGSIYAQAIERRGTNGAASWLQSIEFDRGCRGLVCLQTNQKESRMNLIDLTDQAALADLMRRYRNAPHGYRRQAYRRLQMELHRQLRRAVGK